MGVALQFLLNLANHKPHRSDFVLFEGQIMGLFQSHYYRVKYLGINEDEGTIVLVNVAKLLRSCICLIGLFYLYK